MDAWAHNRIESVFAPLEWAQIALQANSPDEAHANLCRRLGRATHINSLLLIGAAKLPGRYRKGQNIAFPTAPHLTGVSISEDWMDFLSVHGARDPLPRQFNLQQGALCIWEGCEAFECMRDQDKAFTKHYFDFGLRRGIMSVNINLYSGQFDAMLFESHASQREFQSLFEGRSQDVALAYAWFCEAMQVKQLAHAKPPLTSQQRTCLQGVSQGYNTSQIADRLRLSEATVNEHVRLATIRLGATTRVQASARAALLEIITDD